jgi:hypothetical protein
MIVRSRGRVLAVAGWLVAVGATVVAILLWLGSGSSTTNGFLDYGGVAVAGFAALQLAFASMGALLAVKRPANTIGWLMLVVGMGFALSTAAVEATVATGSVVAAWVAFATWPLSGVAMITSGFLYPTGRPQTARWRRALTIQLAIWVVLYLAALVQPGPLLLFDDIPNPIGLGPDLAVSVGARSIPLVLTWQGVMTVLVATALVSRYRGAGAVERAQLRWFLVAVALTMVLVFVPSLGVAALMVDRDALGASLAVGIFALASALIPVTIGVAILRHRLYDIDRLISRGLAYGAVSLILGAVFALAALVLGGLLAGVGQGQSIAVAGSTLLVLGLFQPLRQRIQRLVDQRFDRERYDAERTVAALVGRLRADVDLESVRSDVVGVLGATFRPTQAGVWLRPSVRDRAQHGIS